MNPLRADEAIAEKTAQPRPPSSRMYTVIATGERQVRIRERYSLATIGFHSAMATRFIRSPPRWRA